MKVLRFLPVAFFAAAIFSSCSKSENPDLSIIQAESVIPGSYKMHFYSDETGADNPFVGYTFKFNAGGILLVDDGTTEYNGLWTIENAVNSDTYDQEVQISISGTDDLDKLSNVWYVFEVTDVSMFLEGTGIDNKAQFIKF
ncbi:MAG: hypothetical protein R2794_00630 [Chitinophagales bacterium]